MLKYNTNMTKKDLVDHANELQLRLNDELSTTKKAHVYETDNEQFDSFEDFLTHAVAVGMVDVSTFPTEEEQEAEAEEEMRIHKQKQADKMQDETIEEIADKVFKSRLRMLNEHGTQDSPELLKLIYLISQGK